MEVTEVSRIRGKVCLTIGGERILITKKLYQERPLEVGDDIDLDEYDRFLLLHQYRPALEYAVSLLAARPRAAKEIEDHLARIGYRPQTIEMVMYKLSSNQLLDDTSFAQQWAEHRASMKQGKKRIVADLQRKGIQSEVIQEALASISEQTQQDAAYELALKGLRRQKPGEDIRKAVQRTLAMLLRRGYDYEQSKTAIANARDELGA